jgi:hypothetical protein
MQEDIAKTKLCIGPPALVSATLISGQYRNVQVGTGHSSNCRGSACVGWVEVGEDEGDCCFRLQALAYVARAGQTEPAPARGAKKGAE